MSSKLRVLIIFLGLLLSGSAFSGGEYRGDNAVLNNNESSRLSMHAVLIASLQELKKRRLSIPKSISLESDGDNWKVVFYSENCSDFAGDSLFINKENESVRWRDSDLSILLQGDFDKSIYEAFDKSFSKTYSDALSAYKNLESEYRICIKLDGNELYIDYDLSNPRARGGGPHYKVDFVSGEILESRYYQ